LRVADSEARASNETVRSTLLRYVLAALPSKAVPLRTIPSPPCMHLMPTMHAQAHLDRRENANAAHAKELKVASSSPFRCSSYPCPPSVAHQPATRGRIQTNVAMIPHALRNFHRATRAIVRLPPMLLRARLRCNYVLMCLCVAASNFAPIAHARWMAGRACLRDSRLSTQVLEGDVKALRSERDVAMRDAREAAIVGDRSGAEKDRVEEVSTMQKARMQEACKARMQACNPSGRCTSLPSGTRSSACISQGAQRAPQRSLGRACVHSE
jgi:hypothetical protein